jgi:acetolactate synthase I/III small subunit
MVHTFAVYVDNKPGVLNRGHTETPGLSRMTVVVDTDEYGARRLEAHLYKLVPVRRVEDITTSPSISRDLALIKVSATGDARTHVMQLVDVYRARIVDVSPESLVIETTGTEDKIDSLLEVLRPYGVIEMVRTGRVSMARGTNGAKRPDARPLPAAEIGGDVSSCSV